ncbi:DNA-directed RNA polymerases I, II, and III subunit RPABC1 [Tetrabaena socialis]|uniref:DNA-directed RNA polymerases I, II, and III subunit RPABC1 n=1 Tax=Tetrabaena socialis TaxID=47790 RepID=A0A2J8A390_9CHLO|nr:DNA-directed RNA polymerases I, II, and III subunit RPABC1 [Tetrabaena socialis]|eukprot:PNH06992.1 DNA-directed RNA polymerases I, II, and III subunit RPABC1 [Tetrabaena socialis]
MDQAQEIIKSFDTIVDMMRDRDLFTDLQDLVDYRDQQIMSVASSARLVFSIDFSAYATRIVYNMHPKFKVNDIKKLLDYEGTIILVSKEKPGTLALKGLDEAAHNIHVFDVNELQFNVSRNALVPKHEPIRNEADIDAIIKSSRVKSKFNLPLIHNTDPMARYLALKPGELVRITRLSPSAGEYVSYRCCIKVN